MFKAHYNYNTPHIVTLKEFCILPTPYSDEVHIILRANSDYLLAGLYSGDEFVVTDSK